MGFKLPMPKEHIRYYQHAKFRVPIFKTMEVIAVYSFQCKVNADTDLRIESDHQ